MMWRDRAEKGSWYSSSYAATPGSPLPCMVPMLVVWSFLEHESAKPRGPSPLVSSPAYPARPQGGRPRTEPAAPRHVPFHAGHEPPATVRIDRPHGARRVALVGRDRAASREIDVTRNRKPSRDAAPVGQPVRRPNQGPRHEGALRDGRHSPGGAPGPGRPGVVWNVGRASPRMIEEPSSKMTIS